MGGDDERNGGDKRKVHKNGGGERMKRGAVGFEPSSRETDGQDLLANDDPEFFRGEMDRQDPSTNDNDKCVKGKETWQAGAVKICWRGQDLTRHQKSHQNAT